MFYIDILDKSGVKVAQLSQEECTATVRRVINGEWSINIVYPVNRDNDKSAYLNARKVRARVIDTKNPTEYQTFVLNRPNLQKSANGSIVLTVDGSHISMSSMKSEIITDVVEFFNENPDVIINRILGYSSYNIGTYPATMNKISVKLSWESVLSALQKVISVSGLEWTVDEAHGEIDFSYSLGSATKYIHVREGKNLKSIRMTRYEDTITNKLYGIGGGDIPISIAGAQHKIQSVVSQVVSVDHSKLCVENDCWNNYKIKVESGTLRGQYFTVTDSARGANYDSLTLSGTITGLSAGDYISICNSDNSYVNYLYAPESVTANGLCVDVFKNTKYSDTKNHVLNAALDGAYTAGLAQDFSKLGSPTVSQNSNQAFIKHGLYSQRVQCSTLNTGVYQDVPELSSQYYVVKAHVYLVSGAIKLRMTLDGKTFETASITQTGWNVITQGIYKNTSGTIGVYILQSGATSTEFYLDALQVSDTTLDNNGDVDDRKFVKRSEQLDLWFETYDKLISVKDPKVEYIANFVDLNKISPLDYPFEKIELGDTVLITDENIGVNALPARITQLYYNVFKPELTEHTITTSAA